MEQRNVLCVAGALSTIMAGLTIMLVAPNSRADEQARSATRVYQCTKNGERVFSDQPCGPDAQARDVAVVNRMDAVAVKVTSNSRIDPRLNSHVVRHRSTQPKSEALDAVEQRCKKIGRDKAAIDSRMRSGYSAAQGERLRERLRKLGDEHFELRCSRFG